MNKKNKIELVVIVLLVFLVLVGVSWLSPRNNIHQEESPSERLIADDMMLTSAENYQLQELDSGIKIFYYPLGCTVFFSEDWQAEIKNIDEYSSFANIYLRGSSFDANGILLNGCSVDLRFAQSPLRRNSTLETISSLKENSTETANDRYIESITLGEKSALKEYRVAKNGHLFVDIIVPLQGDYLLDIAAIFSENYRQECSRDLNQSLSAMYCH